MSVLTLEEANRIAQGVMAEAQKMGIRINVTVCDPGGRLIVFQRMNDAVWAGVFGSQGKAMAAVAFGRPSGLLTERADTPTFRGIVALEGGHMIMGQGGMPVLRDGVVIGGVGVGGGTSQEDEDCAIAGIALL
jgi:glc operon protein GlcG